MMTTASEDKPILIDKIEKYRQAEFEEMGFDSESAGEMACLRNKKSGGYEFDVHETRKRLRDLLEAGCPAHLAAQIVL